MRFVKLETSGPTTRWINLEQVSRVTLAEDSPGHRLLVVVFSDGQRDSQLRLSTEDPVDRQAIDYLVECLDVTACGPSS